MPKLDDPQLHYQLKVLGVAMFIPLLLGVGPIAGFFIGHFLVKQYAMPLYVIFICITLGAVSVTLETIRLVKFLFRETK